MIFNIYIYQEKLPGINYFKQLALVLVSQNLANKTINLLSGRI